MIFLVGHSPTLLLLMICAAMPRMQSGSARFLLLLPGKYTMVGDLTVHRQGCPDGKFDHLFIQNRENTRQPLTYRTGICVRRCAKLGAARTKDFRFGHQLGMDFKSDHCFIRCHNLFLTGLTRLTGFFTTKYLVHPVILSKNF